MLKRRTTTLSNAKDEMIITQGIVIGIYNRIKKFNNEKNKTE